MGPQLPIYPGCSSNCLPLSTWSLEFGFFHSVVHCCFQFFHAVFETMSSAYSGFKVSHTPRYVDWIPTYPCYPLLRFLFISPIIIIPHFKPYSDQVVVTDVKHCFVFIYPHTNVLFPHTFIYQDMVYSTPTI